MTAWTIFFGILMFSTALFLILLVLVQRGRGGGLSGALGGMGGQSAFGTKAGDLFTRITIVVATFWILLCIGAILMLNRQSSVSTGAGGDDVEYVTPEMQSREPKAKAEGQDADGAAGAGALEAEAKPAATSAAADTGTAKDTGEAQGSTESKK